MTVEPTEPSHFVPAKNAAERVGYSLDYVSRLAREGKVAAERRGRSWFIDPESVKLFALEAEAQQRQRSEELRQIRKLELARMQQQYTSAATISILEQPSYSSLAQAAVFTLALALSLSVSWTAYDAKIDMRAFSFGASSLGELVVSIFEWPWTFTQETTTNSVPTAVTTIPETTPVSDPIKSAEAATATSTTEGLVVLPATTTDEELESIKESFSDEVEIEFTDDGTGVITPHFKEESGESYRFLLVPVNTQ